MGILEEVLTDESSSHDDVHLFGLLHEQGHLGIDKFLNSISNVQPD
jgi:hypothetical protein